MNPLDLSPLLELRAEAEALTDELRYGNTTAGDRARELLAAETAILDAFMEAVAEHGGDRHSENLIDIVAALGTGDLGYVLDVAEGRV